MTSPPTTGPQNLPTAMPSAAEMLAALQTVGLDNGDATYDGGHLAAGAGVTESELPARCIDNWTFVSGFRAGMSERHINTIVNAIVPDGGMPPWDINELVGAIEDLNVRTLGALAGALQNAKKGTGQ